MTHRFRTQPTRNTTAAGYGNEHMKERRRRLPLTKSTDPCAHCGRPLGPERMPGDTASRWHLPHNDTRTGYLPGFAHARCNIVDGAKRGNRIQKATRPSVRRNWYAGVMAATGTCAICGTPFVYSHAEQKTCGRTCGVEWRRLHPTSRAPRPPQQGTTRRVWRFTRECVLCHQPYGTNRPGAITCSSACSHERNARRARERYRSRKGLPSTADHPVRRRCL